MKKEQQEQPQEQYVAYPMWLHKGLVKLHGGVPNQVTGEEIQGLLNGMGQVGLVEIKPAEESGEADEVKDKARIGADKARVEADAKVKAKVAAAKQQPG